VTDDELRDLAESAHQLDELTKHPGWAVFTELADMELDKHRRSVLGGALDPDRYRREAGVIAGGEMVARIPEHVADLYQQALARAAEEEDDDAVRAA
jgi:hypothetical protein